MYNPLYKLDSKGLLRIWEVSVDQANTNYFSVNTKSGVEGGAMKIVKRVITEGKNRGKINETTIAQQAHNEAQSAWKKKAESDGYNEDRSLTLSGGGDSIIRPMLASDYVKYKNKFKFPVYTQPKLDGIRCIAKLTRDGEVSLFTRKGKKILSMKHIEDAIRYYKGKIPDKKNEVIFDGELYNHEYKHNFEFITSIVRKAYHTNESTQINYHIYDIVDKELTQKERYEQLIRYNLSGEYHLRLVPSQTANDFEDLELDYDISIKEGYEGLMVRNQKSNYEHKRSTNLLKYKNFKESEFTILDYTTSTSYVGEDETPLTKLNFVCKMKEDEDSKFEVPMMGSQEFINNLITDPPIGKKLTVKYFGLTNKSGVPRFPIGKVIRDYE